MDDCEYLSRRAAAEAEMAKRATSPSARLIHEKMAQLYMDVIDDGRRASEHVARPLS